ncbi:MAG: glycosyltransferase [Acetobacteraceae bacterium]|nr:glycosyltransferase [Acetobacteraceae bacterium]
MRVLFVHQNFPGQFLHLVRHLVADPAHDVLFVTEANANFIAGVRKVIYRGPPAVGGAVAADLPSAMTRAAAVAGAAGQLQSLGYRPDIVVGHHGWGELLNIGDVWPDVPVLGYFEFFYRTEGLDVGFDPEFPLPPSALGAVRAKNAVNLLALTNPGMGQTPTRFQQETYPGWAQERIAVVAEGVDLAICRPDPTARRRAFALGGFRVELGDELLTYVARDLEPYRGFHVLMRALPRLLRERPRLKVVIVGGDGVSYGAALQGMSWRSFMLAEIGGLDPARVLFAGKVDYSVFIALLLRSDAHVYLTYPFVASWSLREAMASGCAIVGSDTAPVREFIEDGVSGLLTPCLDPARLAERVLELLEDRGLAAALRAGARRFAEAHLRLDETLQRQLALIARVAEGDVREPPRRGSNG